MKHQLQLMDGLAWYQLVPTAQGCWLNKNVPLILLVSYCPIDTHIHYYYYCDCLHMLETLLFLQLYLCSCGASLKALAPSITRHMYTITNRTKIVGQCPTLQSPCVLKHRSDGLVCFCRGWHVQIATFNDCSHQALCVIAIFFSVYTDFTQYSCIESKAL